jgi:hypothetical protein
LLEGARLQVPQVDSARLLLHIHGKGKQDRYVPCPPRCWRCCARTGAPTARRRGCSRHRRGMASPIAWRTTAVPSRAAVCRVRFVAPSREAGSRRPLMYTRCAIRTRPTYSKRV